MVALSSYAGSVADRLRVNEAEQEIKMASSEKLVGKGE